MNLFCRILSTLSKKDELRIIHAHRNLKSTSNISVGKIAIACDFAIVLQDNGWELKLIGHNPNFRQLSGMTQNQFVKLAAGFDGYMVGMNYTFAKNMVGAVEWYDLDSKAVGADIGKKDMKTLWSQMMITF